MCYIGKVFNFPIYFMREVFTLPNVTRGGRKVMHHIFFFFQLKMVSSVAGSKDDLGFTLGMPG